MSKKNETNKQKTEAKKETKSQESQSQKAYFEEQVNKLFSNSDKYLQKLLRLRGKTKEVSTFFKKLQAFKEQKEALKPKEKDKYLLELQAFYSKVFKAFKAN